MKLNALRHAAVLIVLISSAIGASAQKDGLKGLRDASDSGKLPFRIGTAVSLHGGTDREGVYSPGLLTGENSKADRDANYRRIVDHEFNQMQPGNDLKMSSVWTGVHRDAAGNVVADCDFKNLNALADYALAHKGMAIRGHVMVYNAMYQLPRALADKDWATNTATLKPGFTASDVRDAVHSYVTQLVHATLAVNAHARLHGHPAPLYVSWDVSNEVVADHHSSEGPNGFQYPAFDFWHNNGPKGFWGDQTGWDYIGDIYRWAKDTMRSDIARHTDGIEESDRFLLYYTDFGAEWDPLKWAGIQNVIKHIRATGGEVDGIGFQAHLIASANDVSQSQLSASIRDTIAMGLHFSITENDVRIRMGETTPSLERRLGYQSDNYYQTVELCRRNAAYCDCWQVWGVEDDGSWIPGTFPGWGSATLFTPWDGKRFEPKDAQPTAGKAYLAVFDALNGLPKP